MLGDWDEFDARMQEATPVIARARFAPGDMLDLLDQAAILVDEAGHRDRAASVRAFRATLDPG